MTTHISYVSDVLCIWAYVAEARLDELRKEFGASIALEYRFIPVFGATKYRIGELGDKTDEIVVYCQSGNRSAMAKRLLESNGFTNVHDLGGIGQW